MGPGTEGGTNVQIIAQLWPRRDLFRSAARLDGYMLKQKWSEIKEKFVKKELVAQGFEISRGDEWFYVKTSELSKFKKIVTENMKIKTDEYVVPRAGTRIRKKKVIVSV